MIDKGSEFVNPTDRERARDMIRQDEKEYIHGCLSSKCFLVVSIGQVLFTFTITGKGKWRRLIVAAEEEKQRLVSRNRNETWQMLVEYWTWINVR